MAKDKLLKGGGGSSHQRAIVKGKQMDGEPDSVRSPSAVTNGSSISWYESTLLWGAIGVFFGIVLTVVAAMKHDLRWLLVIAWPFWGMASYAFFVKVIPSRPWRWSLIVGSSLAVGGALTLLNYKLRPSWGDVNHGTRFGAQLISRKGDKSVTEAMLTLENTDNVLDEHVYISFGAPEAITNVEIDNPERVHLVSGGPNALGFVSPSEIEFSAPELAPGELRSITLTLKETKSGDFKVALRSDRCPQDCKNAFILGPDLYTISAP